MILRLSPFGKKLRLYILWRQTQDRRPTEFNYNIISTHFKQINKVSIYTKKPQHIFRQTHADRNTANVGEKLYIRLVEIIAHRTYWQRDRKKRKSNLSFSRLITKAKKINN